MDIRNFFNLVLLGLSLTTLLITLISYILFRVRYSLAFHKKPDLHKVEGQFFKRYAPLLEDENRHHKTTLKQKSDRPGRTRKKLALVFTLAFVFVMGLIAAEHQLSFRSEMARKIKSAEEYRRLLSAGLLKTHQLDLSRGETHFAEKIPRFVSEGHEELATHARSLKILLISARSSQDLPLHQEALKRWQGYFDRQKIPCRVIKEIPESTSAHLLILPQLQKLNATERGKIERLAKGANVLVTGALGVVDETNEFSSQWFAERFRLTIEPVLTDEKRNMTTFFLQRQPWWILPAGLLLSWFPIDSQYAFSVLDEKRVAAVEANFRGEVVSQNGLIRTRLLTLEEDSHRTLWTALDPQMIDEEVVAKEPNSITYSDTVLLSAMVWTARQPQVYMGAWPHGQSGLLNVSLNLGDLNEGTENFIRKVGNLKVPITLFLASQAYKSNPDSFEFLETMPEIEVATMGPDGQSMIEFDKSKDFQLIENSRLDIEEQRRAEVMGFKPPQEEYNEDLLDAAAQNGLHYFFGDRRFVRLSPVALLDGDILFIPRAADDDMALRRNQLLDTPAKIVNYLVAKTEAAFSLGGLYTLNFNKGVVQEPFYLRAFIEFLTEAKKREMGIVTLSEVTRWWELRSGVKISLLVHEEDGSRIALITLTNQNSEEVEGVSLYLDPGQSSVLGPELTRQPAAAYEWKSDHFQIQVPRLRAKEVYTLKIHLGPNFGK